MKHSAEWWAVFAATFSERFDRHVCSHGFGAASEARSIHAEHAGAVADEALRGYAEAKHSGEIGIPPVRRKK